MAERRMFSKLVVDADRFLDLPRGARLLYFELGMRCDDDGFCAAPGSILRMTGASREDFAALTAAGFVADLGPAALLLDWRVSNSLRSDRLRRLSFPELAEQALPHPRRPLPSERRGGQPLPGRVQTPLSSPPPRPLPFGAQKV